MVSPLSSFIIPASFKIAYSLDNPKGQHPCWSNLFAHRSPITWSSIYKLQTKLWTSLCFCLSHPWYIIYGCFTVGVVGWWSGNSAWCYSSKWFFSHVCYHRSAATCCVLPCNTVLFPQIPWNPLLLRTLSWILNLLLPQLLQLNANRNKLTFLSTLFLDMWGHQVMHTLKLLRRQLRTLLPFSQTVGWIGLSCLFPANINCVNVFSLFSSTWHSCDAISHKI